MTNTNQTESDQNIDAAALEAVTMIAKVAEKIRILIGDKRKLIEHQLNLNGRISHLGGTIETQKKRIAELEKQVAELQAVPKRKAGRKKKT